MNITFKTKFMLLQEHIVSSEVLHPAKKLLGVWYTCMSCHLTMVPELVMDITAAFLLSTFCAMNWLWKASPLVLSITL